MKIRTVFQPDVEIDVPDDEAEAARLQGLVHACTGRCTHPGGDVSASAAAPQQAAAKPVPAGPTKTATPDPSAGVSASADQASATEKG